jgi:shikimate dehydrogenase
LSEVFLLGHPVSHSLSPAMHNAAFKALGLPHKYSTRDVVPEKLADVVGSLRGETALGANLTIPHKEAALRLVDQTSDDAKRIGAVNTIVRRGSRLVGDNTDKYGFEKSLAEVAGGHADVAGFLFLMDTVLVLGAGGAARSCVLALLEHENTVLVANRDRARGEALVAAMRPFVLEGRSLEVVDWPRAGEHLAVDGVVNATPLGLQGEDPLPGVDLPLFVVDIVPTAKVTPLVSRARASEHRVVVDGLPMLLHQAARSFELWTGVPAPLEAMRAALPRPA